MKSSYKDILMVGLPWAVFLLVSGGISPLNVTLYRHIVSYYSLSVRLC